METKNENESVIRITATELIAEVKKIQREPKQNIIIKLRL